MDEPINRREFLKLLGLLPVTKLAWPYLGVKSGLEGGKHVPNVLVLVYDTLSANHVTFHGYPRETTPNLARFAERSTVYHRCYSAGNFTSPGTASLLTGAYPWSHRALHLQGTVSEAYTNRNLFNLFTPETYKVAYTHNPWVSLLLHQFRGSLSRIERAQDLYLDYGAFLHQGFLADHNGAFWSEQLIFHDRPLSSSLFFSALHRLLRYRSRQELGELFKDEFPRGIPNYEDTRFFLLEDATDWMMEELANLPRPFVAYFHLLPPHEPYKPRREFVDSFLDGWQPERKERRHFSWILSESELNHQRRHYDEFLAYTDAEFGRLLDFMEGHALFEDTCVVFTSDHGQLFERGIHGHVTETLYEPVIRVPMLISGPGRSKRQDVYEPVSTIDMLPTLLHLTGQPIPEWCEGQVLPGFVDGSPNSERRIYAVEAKGNPKQSPITKGTIALVKGDLKLVKYFGYQDHTNAHEMYDAAHDPEEYVDLYRTRMADAGELDHELVEKLRQVNQPYL